MVARTSLSVKLYVHCVSCVNGLKWGARLDESVSGRDIYRFSNRYMYQCVWPVLIVEIKANDGQPKQVAWACSVLHRPMTHGTCPCDYPFGQSCMKYRRWHKIVWSVSNSYETTEFVTFATFSAVTFRWELNKCIFYIYRAVSSWLLSLCFFICKKLR